MQVRVLGVRITRFYVNNTDHTPFKWGGSDVLMTDGFLDSPNLDATEFLLWFTSLSHSEIRKVFATCDGPTCLRVDGSDRLHIAGGDFEAQGNPDGTAGAAILINGGFVDLDQVATQDSNCDVAGSGRPSDRGRITVNGGVARITNLMVGDRTTGCSGRLNDLADVQVNGGKAVIINGLRRSGADITVRKQAAADVEADVPVTVE